MGLVAKNSGGDFVLAPTGTHRAVCTQVIDLGTQFSAYYGKSAHKVVVGWEIDADEKGNDGKPLMVFKRYTMSLHENAALRGHLEAWRGRAFTEKELEGFSLKNIIGKSCLVTVAHTKQTDRTYANVSTVTALPKGMTALEQVGKSILFDVEDPDMTAFDAFGEALKVTIKKSVEWKEKHGSPPNSDADELPTGGGSEEIPF